MKFELIGNPRIEDSYQWETTMVCNVRRDDGETGDVWIVAGVPEYLRESSGAAGTQHGYQYVWVFGDPPDMWCPESLRPTADSMENPVAPYDEIAEAIIVACKNAALAAHRARVA
jgi:hypothetical protein